MYKILAAKFSVSSRLTSHKVIPRRPALNDRPRSLERSQTAEATTLQTSIHLVFIPAPRLHIDPTHLLPALALTTCVHRPPFDDPRQFAVRRVNLVLSARVNLARCKQGTSWQEHNRIQLSASLLVRTSPPPTSFAPSHCARLNPP